LKSHRKHSCGEAECRSKNKDNLALDILISRVRVFYHGGSDRYLPTDLDPTIVTSSGHLEDVHREQLEDLHRQQLEDLHRQQLEDVHREQKAVFCRTFEL
jgi:hypothetical protein